MAVKFKVIEKGQPGVTGGGTKKFYATPVHNGEITLEKLTSSIEKISTVSGADIRAVLYSLVEVMNDSLSDGNIVRIGDLGSLRVGLSSEGKETAEEVKSFSVKNSKLIFTPGKMTKNMLKNLTYRKS